MPFVFTHVEYCDMHFVYGFCYGNSFAVVDEYQSRFPNQRIPSRGVCSHTHQKCVRLVVFQVLLCSLKGMWCHWLTHERTFLRWFREVHDCPIVELPLASACNEWGFDELYMRKIYILIMITGHNTSNQRTCSTYGFVTLDGSTSPNVKRQFIHRRGAFTRDGINNSRNLHTWFHHNPHEKV